MSVPAGYETFKRIGPTLVTSFRIKLNNFDKDFPLNEPLQISSANSASRANASERRCGLTIP